MKKRFSVKGLKTLKKSGSLIFCEKCGRILGSINEFGYRYIYLGVSCDCEVDMLASLEISLPESTSNPYEPVNRMPKTENGIAVCEKCGTPMFGIIDGRVKNYSFYVECICGEKYDLRSTFSSRLGETLSGLKNIKNPRQKIK